MSARAHLILGIHLLLAIASLSAARADWGEDGIPVCARERNQSYPVLLPDGGGGTYIAWLDDRDTDYEQVYLQRLDAEGRPLWAIDGVLLSSGTGSTGLNQIVADGAGGVIVVWRDSRAGNQDIYAQRVSAAGTPQWTAGGKAVCAHTSNQGDHRICADGLGGVLVAWWDQRNGVYGDVFAQRLDGNGTVLWTAVGVTVCSATNDQKDPVVAADGTGGGYVVWADKRNATDYSIYAQRLSGAGAAQWTNNGIGIATATGTQDLPQAIPDGTGGVYMIWRDTRSGSWDVFAQRTASNASPYWTGGGIPISTQPEQEYGQELVPDGRGGFLASFNLVAAHNELYVARVNASGLILYKSLAGISTTWSRFRIASDGDGGAFVAWNDDSAMIDEDVFAQRLSATGNSLWQAGGQPVCRAEGNQYYPEIVASGDGGATLAWMDSRNTGSMLDVYAQHLDADGRWGRPEPVIHSVLDVPGDQGGLVNLAWDASDYDAGGDVTYYSLWRALASEAMAGFDPEIGRPASASALAAPAAAEAVPAAVTTTARVAADLEGATALTMRSDGTLVREQLLAGTTYYWELVDTRDAYRLDAYAAAVPTLFDSTAVCHDLHYFQVIAHTAIPAVFYVSAPDSGYSVDDLAPAVPLDLAGTVVQEPLGLDLEWVPNTEPDLAGYRVYRGDTAGFVPSPENLLAAPTETGCLDPGWQWTSPFWYKVSALDVHGNESLFAVLAPGLITDVPSPAAPAATSLEPNRPNPFNPLTRIRFRLAESGPVRITVHDVAGRLVRVLVDGARAAGLHEVVFDGRDDQGRAVASGTYYCRLTAGTFRQTRTMSLVR